MTHGVVQKRTRPQSTPCRLKIVTIHNTHQKEHLGLSTLTTTRRIHGKQRRESSRQIIGAGASRATIQGTRQPLGNAMLITPTSSHPAHGLVVNPMPSATVVTAHSVTSRVSRCLSFSLPLKVWITFDGLFFFSTSRTPDNTPLGTRMDTTPGTAVLDPSVYTPPHERSNAPIETRLECSGERCARATLSTNQKHTGSGPGNPRRRHRT